MMLPQVYGNLFPNLSVALLITKQLIRDRSKPVSDGKEERERERERGGGISSSDL
jgi:hypothetical protein